MKVWVRRLSLVLFALFWLALILTPTLAFVLARNGQVQIGRTEGRHWRLFLLQEANAEGLGLERGGPVSPPFDAPDGIGCLKTSVVYWMWSGPNGSSGDRLGTSYCQCTDSDGNLADVVPPACMIIK